MSGEECLPGHVRAALRCRLDAVILEDRFDRVAGDVAAETLEPTPDARVAPGRVLLCHAHYQRGEVRLGARATRTSRVRAIVFLRHERPIPPQDRVRCDDADDARTPTPSEDLAFHGQAAALVVGEAEPSRSVRCAQDPVLLEQIVNDRLLLPVDPAGEEENDEGKRRRERVHAASVPERLARCKTRQIRDRAPLGWGRVPGHKPPAIASNTAIVD